MLKHKDRYIKLIFSLQFEKFLFSKSWAKYNSEQEFSEDLCDELIKNYRLLYDGVKYEEAMHQIKKLDNDCMELYGRFTPFEILAISTDALLLNESGKVKVKYSEYFNWLGHTNKLSEDVLSVCFLVNNNLSIKNLSYLANIRHDNTHIERVLSRGLSENHMHYNANSGNKHFNYFGLIIYEKDSYIQKFSKIEKFVKQKKEKNRLHYNTDGSISYNLQYLIYLRKYIETCIIGNNESDIQDYWVKYDFKNKIVDEFQIDLMEKYDGLCIKNPNNYDNKINKKFDEKEALLEFYQIEREFIFEVLKVMQLDDNYHNKQICMQYLYLKNYFEKKLIHNKKYLGFETFLEFENIKDLFFSDSETLKKRYSESIFLVNNDHKVKKLEYRTTPKDVDDTLDYMVRNEGYSKEIEVGNVIHYIKKQGYTKRNVEYSSENKQQALLRNEINTLIDNAIYISYYHDISTSKIEDNPKNNFHLVGIDAANAEIGCRPEVYAQLFRALTIGSKASNKRLNLTYHVGEEYESLISGIRAIDEVLEFYPMKYGDRLGHALALGKNVEDYYERVECIYSDLGTLLDDLVWLHQKLIQYKYPDIVFQEFLSEQIKKYLLQISRWSETSNCSEKNNTQYKLSSLHLTEYYASMQLRSDNPLMYKREDIYELKYSEIFAETKIPRSTTHNNFNINNPEYREYFKDVVPRFLNYLYHFDESYNNLLNKEVTYNFENTGFVDAVSFVQQKMREKVDRKGIGIEVNVSSNYIISDFDYYKDHPLFKFTDNRLNNGKNDMLVSINTDDAGVFDTSLYKEYTIIAKTLESEGYGSSKILEYIEHLIKMSKEQSWINEK